MPEGLALRRPRRAKLVLSAMVAPHRTMTTTQRRRYDVAGVALARRLRTGICGIQPRQQGGQPIAPGKPYEEPLEQEESVHEHVAQQSIHPR